MVNGKNLILFKVSAICKTPKNKLKLSTHQMIISLHQTVIKGTGYWSGGKVICRQYGHLTITSRKCYVLFRKK